MSSGHLHSGNPESDTNEFCIPHGGTAGIIGQGVNANSINQGSF
jgi:hypothetical protein